MSTDAKCLVREAADATFREFVRSALSARGIRTTEWTEFYLVRLLRSLLEASPVQFSRALGPQLLAAQHLPREQRFGLLKDLADTSLLLSGLFIDHVEEAAPTTEYFFDIGRSAYLHLGEFEDSHLAGPAGFIETFQDLGERFEDFAGALTWIADRELFATSEHTMNVYRRWLDERGQRDEVRLVSAGLIPAGNDTDELH
jgi:hypothetical protein